MASITPVAFYTGGTSIPGTSQYGNLNVGTSPQDYGVVGNENGIVYYATPDEDLGYVIAHEDPSGGHNGKPGNVPAKVGFWRSSAKDNPSFISLVEYVSGQNFDSAGNAATWLESNGYWTSYPTPNVTGGTGTNVVYTTGTFFDAFTSQAGITNTDAFNTNNGCWQLYYSHQEININSGTGNIGLNPHTSGSNSWTWYYAISNSVNTIGDWGSVQQLSASRSGSYVGGVLTLSNINTNVTIPANRYFLIGNSGGPFYRTVKSLGENRTANVSGSPFVTAINKVCLGNWPSGGTTGIPSQFGGATGGYTFYGNHAHVHSVTFN